jgi:hypothetical protein
MTDESTTDDQSEPDEQKADFAARAEKIRSTGHKCCSAGRKIPVTSVKIRDTVCGDSELMLKNPAPWWG